MRSSALWSWRSMLGAAMFFAFFACRSSPELPVLHSVADFDLEAANGVGEPPATFTRTDLEGQYHLVSFIFTECPLACPTMTQDFKRLYTDFPSDDLGFVSISVDPDNDTVDALARYRDKLEVDPDRWRFVRGDIDEVRELSEKGFLLAASDLPYGHSLRFVLVDPEAQIRGFYQSDDREHLERLRSDLRSLF